MWAPYAVTTLFASYDLNEATALSLSVESLEQGYYIAALAGWTPAPGHTIRLDLQATF